MKKYFITTLLFVLSIYLTFSQTKSEGMALANCVLTSLKTSNDSLIIQCIPSRQEFNYLAECSSEKIPIPMDSVMKSISNGILKNINRIYEKGQNEQINWSLVKIDSISVIDLKPQFDKIKKANIIVYLSQGEIHFSLTLTKCLFITDAWRIMDPIVWKD